METEARESKDDRQVYYALIGDVVNSRSLPDRAGVQRRLQEPTATLNRELEDGALAAPLRVTAGDEVQALLERPEPVVDITVRLADHLHPVRLTWGLGRGTLTTELGGDVATLDGPCFHRARRAAERAAEEDRWLLQEGLPSPHGRTLTALFALMSGIRSEWTEIQAKYVREVRGRRQKDVAEKVGRHKSTISKALASSRYEEIEEGEGAARDLLSWIASDAAEGGGAEGAGERGEGSST